MLARLTHCSNPDRGFRATRWLTIVVSLAGAAAIAACGSTTASRSGGSSASVATNSPSQVAARHTILSQYGFSPAAGSIPNLACHDNSYAKAVRSGLVYGTYSLPPYSYQARGKTEGNEWDILRAAAAYVGIDKITPKFAPFDSLIPALTAGRIDLMPAHDTPEREKVIAFSGPAYWYGPVIVVANNNPQHITSYANLTRSGVTVAVVSGSAAQIYMHSVNGKTVPYQDQNTELASLSAGRESAALEDGPTVAQYQKTHPSAKLRVVPAVALSLSQLQSLGYSYFVFGIRKSDCSLNLALSRGLEEIRANGVVAAILRRDGLGQTAAVNIPGTQG